MFTNEHRRIVWDEIRQHDLRAFAQWLSPELFTAAAAKAGVGVGKGPLYVGNLAWLGAATAVVDNPDPGPSGGRSCSSLRPR